MKSAKVDLSASATSGQGNETTSMAFTGQGDVILKPADAFHLSLKLTMSGSVFNGTATGDVIQVGGKTYTKTQTSITGVPNTPTPKYIVEEAAPSGESSLLPPKTETNLKVVGEETIRGDKTWHLSGTETTNAEGTPVAAGTSGATTTHVDTWIRESDYYGVRVKMDNWPNTVGSLEEAGLNTPSKATFQIDFSNYDRDITITPPPADQIAGLAPTHHKVGDQVDVDGIWLVTVNSVRTSAGSDYEKPASGNTYLVLNVTMKNQSQQVEDVSTWLQFSLKDDSGQAYSEALTTFTKAAPGGSVEPGGLTRGEFAYEVPVSVHHFTLYFEPEIFGESLAAWDLTV